MTVFLMPVLKAILNEGESTSQTPSQRRPSTARSPSIDKGDSPNRVGNK